MWGSEGSRIGQREKCNTITTKTSADLCVCVRARTLTLGWGSLGEPWGSVAIQIVLKTCPELRQGAEPHIPGLNSHWWGQGGVSPGVKWLSQ